MMKEFLRKCFWISVVLGAIFFSSCRERIEADFLPEDPQLIIINGLIDNSEGPYFVEVQQARSGNQLPIPIENAVVTLVEEGVGRENYVYQEDGRYRAEGQEICGVPGGTYHIEVAIEEDMYISRPETMPAILGQNRLEWEEVEVPSTSANGINITTPKLDFDMIAELPLVDEPVFLMWQFIETYQIRPTDFPDVAGVIPPPCFFIENIGVQNFYLQRLDEFGNASFRLESVIQRDIDISLLVKHIFSIHQSSITENYYQYLELVRLLTENTGSLFDPPLGRIAGNIEQVGGGPPVLGYFAAAMTDTTHMATYRGEIDTYIQDICIFEPTKVGGYAPFCLDCLILSGSSLDVPYWWDRVR